MVSWVATICLSIYTFIVHLLLITSLYIHIYRKRRWYFAGKIICNVKCHCIPLLGQGVRARLTLGSTRAHPRIDACELRNRRTFTTHHVRAHIIGPRGCHHLTRIKVLVHFPITIAKHCYKHLHDSSFDCTILPFCKTNHFLSIIAIATRNSKYLPLPITGGLWPNSTLHLMFDTCVLISSNTTVRYSFFFLLISHHMNWNWTRRRFCPKTWRYTLASVKNRAKQWTLMCTDFYGQFTVVWCQSNWRTCVCECMSVCLMIFTL